jgi:anaerobic magnesium-protoporphyrin IX monomethyl ester cyclase
MLIGIEEDTLKNQNMRILIVNPPHPAIGSRIPKEQLPPLGLLAIGGPLLDAGHDVTLLDCEIAPLSHPEIIRRVINHQPQILIIGHSGSTSAHPIVMELTRDFRQKLPTMKILYGGVFPTYHYLDILENEPQIDVIVRGEGEATVTKVVNAIAKQFVY